MTILALTLLLLVVSLGAGFLGALTGLGGGVVIVPALTLAFHVDIRYAIGASLVAVIATSSGAASAYVREGYTNLRVGMLLEVATTLGAAEAIVKSGFKPKRSLRFVLFTGEEQGLLGSLAYTKTHKDEMQNHVAAVILDSGQGPVVSFNLGGHDDLIPVVRKFAETVKAFGEVKVSDGVTFGTDSGPFVLAGLHGIELGQDSPEYRYTHHSPVDTFDKVKPDVLTRDATIMGLVSFWIADRPERLASPWPAEKTAAMLVDKKQDKSLKAEGIWPFGDLGQKKTGEPEK
jgi:hypothetical protein